MYKVRACFEIAGMAEDENGNPAPAGLQITLGESLKEIPYEELKKSADIEAIAVMFHVKPEDITIITPQEYDERYGDEE